METAASKCCKTRVYQPVKATGANGSVSFLSTLLMILIPKCPLCLTAYMSAMVLFFDIEYETLIPILKHTKPVMGGIILLMILLNRRGRRTLYALGMAGVAMLALLLQTYYYTWMAVPEWSIYLLFIFAIWYNGNFQYFYRFIRFGKGGKPA